MKEEEIEERLALLLLLKRRRKRLAYNGNANGNTGSDQYFGEKKNKEYEEFHRLIEELRTEDREYFFK